MEEKQIVILRMETTGTIPRAGKSGESGKLLHGKFDHLEGNKEFSHEELHKVWWEICWKCYNLPGKFTFCPALTIPDPWGAYKWVHR